MFTTHSPRHSRVMACVLTAALLGPNATFAVGAKETFSRTKPHVNIGFLGPQNVASWFVIDIAQHRDGPIQGRITPLVQGTSVEGTHSAIQARADGGLSATFGTYLKQPIADGSLAPGTLTVEVQAAAPPAGGGGGDIIVAWDIVDSVADADSEADLLEIHFQPASPTEQLSGEPAALFNAPGPGADLVVSFKSLSPGERITVELTVSSNESSTRMTIQVHLQFPL